MCGVKRCVRGSEHARLTHELKCAIITGNYCTPARRRICMHTMLDYGAHWALACSSHSTEQTGREMRSHFQTDPIFWLSPHLASRCDIELCPARVRRQGATVFRAMKAEECLYSPPQNMAVLQKCASESIVRRSLLSQYIFK